MMGLSNLACVRRGRLRKDCNGGQFQPIPRMGQDDGPRDDQGGAVPEYTEVVFGPCETTNCPCTRANCHWTRLSTSLDGPVEAALELYERAGCLGRGKG